MVVLKLKSVVMYYTCENPLRTLKYIYIFIYMGLSLVSLLLFPQNIPFPVALEYSSKRKKQVSSPLYELKPKDIGKKLRHLIQKGLLYEFLNYI